MLAAIKNNKKATAISLPLSIDKPKLITVINLRWKVSHGQFSAKRNNC